MIGGPILGGAARVKWDPTKVKVIGDGNSFFANVTYVQQLQLVAPLSSQFTIQNLGIGGQTYRKMNGLDGGSRADINAALDLVKLNVLFICETTNSAALGRTLSQIIQDCIDYLTATRAAATAAGAKLIIVGSTTIPREATTDAETLALNQLLSAFDAYLMANYKAMGFDAVVDVRTGSVYDFQATSKADFIPYYSLYTDSGLKVHPTGPGCASMASKWPPVLKSLRAR